MLQSMGLQRVGHDCATELKLEFSNCNFEMSRDSIPNHSKIKEKWKMSGVLVNIDKIRKSVDFDK